MPIKLNNFVDAVFPTHVGVFLPWSFIRSEPSGLPHARGGVSIFGRRNGRTTKSSPRTWGCFFLFFFPPETQQVFPTHVGVFRKSVHACASAHCLPHARGGVSLFLLMSRFLVLSSPRTWGCFFPGSFGGSFVQVFPTHVGVFLQDTIGDAEIIGLPHARGGVSKLHGQDFRWSWSSPRTWGCFFSPVIWKPSALVFPTHVGVFPTPRLCT